MPMLMDGSPGGSCCGERVSTPAGGVAVMVIVDGYGVDWAGSWAGGGCSRVG